MQCINLTTHQSDSEMQAQNSANSLVPWDRFVTLAWKYCTFKFISIFHWFTGQRISFYVIYHRCAVKTFLHWSYKHISLRRSKYSKWKILINHKKSPIIQCNIYGIHMDIYSSWYNIITSVQTKTINIWCFFIIKNMPGENDITSAWWPLPKQTDIKSRR